MKSQSISLIFMVTSAPPVEDFPTAMSRALSASSYRTAFGSRFGALMQGERSRRARGTTTTASKLKAMSIRSSSREFRVFF